MAEVQYESLEAMEAAFNNTRRAQIQIIQESNQWKATVTLFTEDNHPLTPVTSIFTSVQGQPTAGLCEGGIYFNSPELIPGIGRWVLTLDPALGGVSVQGSFSSSEGIPVSGVRIGATFIGKLPPGVVHLGGEITLSLTN